MRNIILICSLGFLIAFLFGCTGGGVPLGAKNCDTNINCFLEATKTCQHVVGTIGNETTTELGSKLMTSYELKQISDTNCLFRVSIDELYFESSDYVNKLPANQTVNALSILGETDPSKLNVSVSDPAYDPKNAKDQEKLLTFLINYINRKAKTNLPVLSYCYAEMKDGLIVSASKCDRDFKSILTEWGTELGPLIEKQRGVLESKIIGLGELGLINYKSAINQYDLSSIGLVKTDIFIPANAEFKQFSIDLESFDISHAVDNLKDKLGVSISVSIASTKEEAELFYLDAKNKFVINISSLKVKDGVFGEDSYLSKIVVENGLSTYRLIYVWNDRVVVIDVFSQDMNDSGALEKLEEITLNLNKKLNGGEGIFNLECSFESESKEVCITTQKQEEYTEEVCNKRAYNFQQGQAQGTKSDGLFGYGCYTKVETQVINLEDSQGLFNFESTFVDSTNQELLKKSESFTVNPGVSTTLSIQYDYDCTQDPLPQSFTSNVIPPTKEFCSDITKQRAVSVETCADQIIYTPKCN